MGKLAEKSDQLKSVSSSLKKKATQMRKDSEPFSLEKLLRDLFGMEVTREQAYVIFAAAFSILAYLRWYILPI